MATTNIFYRIPSQRGTRVASIAGTECTLHQFFNHVIDIEGLNRKDFILAYGTKVLRTNSCHLQSISLQNNSHVDILIPLLGGKGGFGSLLRAIGAQIEKTTNRDACRDLSGRRLRDIKREDELRKLIALQEKLQEERKRKRREKLEKLKKKSEDSSTSTSIQQLVAMFDDDNYNKRRLELSDILEAAVDKGIINFKKRQQEEVEKVELEQSKKIRLEGTSEKNKEELVSELSIKPNLLPDTSTEKPIKCNKTKKNDLWLGLEDEDDDI